jgi:LPXTG-site transpeptidase (sortase) family protein
MLVVVALIAATFSVVPTSVAPAKPLPSTGSHILFAPSWSAYRHHGDRPNAQPARRDASATDQALPAGAEARLVIDAIGLDAPIYLGNQSTIDRNVVTHYDGEGGWRAPVAPGTSGTYWLAGHRTVRGTGPFRLVPDVKRGDQVRIVTTSATVTYVVSGTLITGLDTSDEAVYGSDPAASRLLLQTCLPNDERLLVFGELVA